jgi:hypothetical protein
VTLEHHKLLSNVAFNFNLRRYTLGFTIFFSGFLLLYVAGGAG